MAKDEVKVVGTQQERLVCVLTAAEWKARVKETMEAWHGLDTAEMKEASRKKHAQEVIKGLQGEHRRLCEVVRDGKEYREVICNVEVDYKQGERRVVRTDTAEVVSRRALTGEERQRKLPGA